MPRVLVLPDGNVRCAELSQDLALAVPFVLVQHGLKVRQSIPVLPLFARNAAQLDQRHILVSDLRESRIPSYARYPATTNAIQLTHIGIEVF
jgi:hypothetical protein